MFTSESNETVGDDKMQVDYNTEKLSSFEFNLQQWELTHIICHRSEKIEKKP